METDRGIGKVVESDILQGKIKVRLYTGEFDENGIEKLGSEILVFTKEDVKRLDKKDNAKRIKPVRIQSVETEKEQQGKLGKHRKFKLKTHNRKKKRKEEIHDQKD